MNETSNSLTTRREFIKTTSRIAAASALAGVALPHVHAEGSGLIQLALVGCGGRGTGAANNALASKGGPLKLVAMADVFENKLKDSFDGVTREKKDLVDVPQDRKFLGFDGYKKAMDCLKPGDIVILTTPPAFRWFQFAYAIEKGLNVFMEKPVTVDGPTSRKMLKLAEDAKAKNLKVGVGLMSRHSRALQELHRRIENGEIGDVILMRGYRMHGPVGHAFQTKWPGSPSELLWQVRHFHAFLWASGGCFSDFYIHHIDHLCWMKNAWPVKAQALGGRHYKLNPEGLPYVDQNFDSYAVEYTFADGSKFYMDGRCVNGCNDIYSSYVHGSKGLAIAAKSSDCGGPSSIFKGQAMQRPNMLWSSKVAPEEADPYQNEWNDLMDAIRNDKPYSEVEYGVKASLTSSMGRMAAHTGQEISFEDMLNCEHEFAPEVDKLTIDSAAPLQADKDGKYPMPMPGITKKREY
ncbi:MAG TPA: Gfo/Idh/MocA family oxidoreductase [Candidatus Paceibacterota bacterium]|nr:Gfo/Idh/MocA family oxidoreductase [Verrucomicrobiota bacterium]HSA10067.1 Gfo/Idh/MocA family oxidoreductase [Candidatus Paceibacterota bacterium]